MSSPVVVIENLTKNYGPIEAVRGIDLQVNAGEVFGFLGPNGAGKTTTLRCLLGLLHPTAGRVTIFGLDAIRDGVRARARLAYVPGELRLPERLSGAQLVRTLGRMRGGFSVNRPAELAERLQLDLHRPARELSTGNRRKLALVLAFAADAELLVLDEPTNGLDPLMQREFLRLIDEAVAQGTTVLLSSHVLSEVQRAANRVAVLRAGKIIAQGTVEDLRRGARQRIEVWFETDPNIADFSAVPGIQDATFEGRRLTATVTGPIKPLLAVLSRSPVASMLVEEPDLEEAFLDLYERDQ